MKLELEHLVIVNKVLVTEIQKKTFSIACSRFYVEQHKQVIKLIKNMSRDCTAVKSLSGLPSGLKLCDNKREKERLHLRFQTAELSWSVVFVSDQVLVSKPLIRF